MNTTHADTFALTKTMINMVMAHKVDFDLLAFDICNKALCCYLLLISILSLEGTFSNVLFLILSSCTFIQLNDVLVRRWNVFPQ